MYSVNIGASKETTERFKAHDGLADFRRYLMARLLADSAAEKTALDNLHRKALGVVGALAVSNRDGKITADEWNAIYRGFADGRTLVDFLLQRDRIPWKKTAYIKALTPTFRKLVAAGEKHGMGLTASKLPACLIAAGDRPKFAAAVERVHKKLPPEFLTWLKTSEKSLAVCWVMGFKPRGDDARPDRGLPPLVRMLAGENTEILTIVYGPLAADHWMLLREKPVELQNNGLWQSIMACSNGLLVDAKDRTNNFANTVLAFTEKHWLVDKAGGSVEGILVNPVPKSFGENDVDTALHLLFGRVGAGVFFEGSCNPPGGDWSGISVMTSESEVRYLTLPRVSADKAKRPDHVFQHLRDKALLIVVESKEFLSQVETGIGPRLVRYLDWLFRRPASVERRLPKADWRQSGSILRDKRAYVTMAAGLFKDRDEILAVLKRSRTDVVIGMDFQSRPARLYAASSSKNGSRVIKLLQEVAGISRLAEIVVLRSF